MPGCITTAHLTSQHTGVALGKTALQHIEGARGQQLHRTV
jgi:hypothetical protein